MMWEASEAGAPDLPRWAKATLAALVAATLVVSCLPALSWGLWQDETTMAWQAEAGWAIARDRLGDPAQSVLFGYIEALFYFPGPHMEAWLRAPAVIGTLASLFLVYRLAEMFVGKGSGLLALVPLAGSPLMLTYSTQARPYSLALAACLVTLWGVARWLETRSWRHGLTFAVAFAVAVHLQFLFGVFAVVPAFLVWRHARRKQPIAWLQLSAWTALSALLMLPLVIMLRRLSRFPDPSAVPLPTVAYLADALSPSVVLLSLVAFAFLLVPATVRRRALAGLKAPDIRPPLALGAFWFVAPPLLLFVASHLLHKTVLIDRYVLHIVAGQALIVAALFRVFPPILATLGLLACFLPYPILYGIQSSKRADGLLSWRLPTQTVRALDPTAAAPVFVQSGAPAHERDRLAARDRTADIFLRATCRVPAAESNLPASVHLDDNVRAYVRHIADTELTESPVIFVAGLAKHPTLVWVQTLLRGPWVHLHLRRGEGALAPGPPPRRFDPLISDGISRGSPGR